jgi:hypothetical protein
MEDVHFEVYDTEAWGGGGDCEPAVSF